jgi:hypothetical protein
MFIIEKAAIKAASLGLNAGPLVYVMCVHNELLLLQQVAEYKKSLNWQQFYKNFELKFFIYL